ncbi:MAG: hypothetical protein ACO20S_09685 [Paracoccaceae bacterium]
MKIDQFILTVLIITPLVASLTYFNHDKIKAVLDPPKADILSLIEIGDTCGVGHDFFEVVDLETGLRVPVRNKKARIKTREGNRLQLQVSEKFETVKIDIPPVDAEKNLVLSLDCQSDERLKKMLGSFKENF